MAVTSILDPIFSPLLSLPPAAAIILISLLISLVMVLAYKKFTDQDLMKRLKEEIKELQTEMKTLKDNPERMMQIQKLAMETNMKYMMKSMKPTLITFLPIIIIFSWLNAHFAFAPLVAGTDFSVTAEFADGLEGNVSIAVPAGLSLLNGGETSKGIYDHKVIWFLRPASAGLYNLSFMYQDKTYVKDVLVVADADERTYSTPVKAFKKELVKQIKVSNEKLTPFGSLTIFGYQPGWLLTYILSSLLFSIGLRKWMKVY
ncbi:MAG: DUF106 domain-containing protein [Thaumarchaeota archaeon]|nr:DUF106 domain-containing protein [Nitrososphaerota archaeon]